MQSGYGSGRRPLIWGSHLGRITLLALVMSLLVWQTARATGTSIETVSVGLIPPESEGGSRQPTISADGRYVLFSSLSRNLVLNDTNSIEDVFVRDRLNETTERINVASDGTQANGVSSESTISADGRFVAFASVATNLVPGDTNNAGDIFVRDRQTGVTERVSLGANGSQANDGSRFPAISADGRYVAFVSTATNLVADDTLGQPDVFVRDRLTGITDRVSVSSSGIEGNGGSWYPALSANGRYVAFSSEASNLVPGDSLFSVDTFVRDRQTGTTERVSVATGGAPGSSDLGPCTINADGRYVAFRSYSTSLVPADTNMQADIFLRDRVSGTTERVSLASDGTQANGGSELPSISADGRYVAFQSNAANLVTGETTGAINAFVRDRFTATTELISLDSAGNPANGSSGEPSISADGRYVAFMSDADNLVSGAIHTAGDIFLRDRQETDTELVDLSGLDPTQSFGVSVGPSISADGRYVAFVSSANNLVIGDSSIGNDVFVRDRQTSTTVRASVSTSGIAGNGYSVDPAISANGRYVVFKSDVSNLVPGDTNGQADIFVRDLQAGTTERVNLSTSGLQANGGSETPVISGDGRFVAFWSLASNLVAGDTNGEPDIFVRDRQSGATERVNVNNSGTPASGYSGLSPAISGDGRYVAFASLAGNLVTGDNNDSWDIFVRDRHAGTTEQVSVASDGAIGDSDSESPAISGDGRFVAFRSYSSNLVAQDTNDSLDIFVRDRHTGATERVSVSTGGVQGNNESWYLSISANGVYVSFSSYADNLVAGDTNGQPDIFVRNRLAGSTRRVNLSEAGTQGNGSSDFPTAVSADGHYVTFASEASNLVLNDTNGFSDVFAAVNPGFGTGPAAPIAGDDAYETQTNVTLTVSAPGVLANDSDPGGQPLSAALVTGPTHGTLTLNPNGSFNYKPAADYYGSDAFTYRASNGSASSSPATVEIGITPPDLAISNVAVSGITATEATITWKTNLSSTGSVQYGPTRAYGSTASANTPTANHSIALTGLTPSKTYHFRVQSATLLGDNAISGNYTFTTLRPPPVPPDLTGTWRTAVVSCRLTPRVSCSVKASFDVRNAGAGSAKASSLKVYASVDAALDSSDVLVKTLPVSALKPGLTKTVNVTATLPRDLSQTSYLIARLDATDKVNESDETNNVILSSPLPTQPDLKGSWQRFTATRTGTGSRARYLLKGTFVVENTGADANTPFAVRMVLSGDDTLGKDTLLKEFAVSTLPAAGKKTLALAVTLTGPTSLTGKHVFVVVDSANAVTESDEGNNTVHRGPLK